MNNLLKGLHGQDGALVKKLNICSFLSNLNQFSGNLKISYNSNYFSKKCKNGGGGVFVMSPVYQPLNI